MLSAADPCKQGTECHISAEKPKQVGHEGIVLFATWLERNMVTVTRILRMGLVLSMAGETCN